MGMGPGEASQGGPRCSPLPVRGPAGALARGLTASRASCRAHAPFAQGNEDPSTRAEIVAPAGAWRDDARP